MSQTSPPTSLLDEAWRRHGAAVSRFVRSRLPEPDASDAVQAALLRASEHIDQLENPDRARAWLFRIARNVVVDAYRSNQARAWQVPTENPEPIDVNDPAADIACACSVSLAQTLPPSQAEILKLVDLGEATLSEAAQTLGITVNNATVRLHRARKALREKLWTHCGVSNPRECSTCRCIDDGCCDA